MTTLRRVVSFSLSERGIGHASRLVAVHSALREIGWRSLFFVERQQPLIADYGFDQIVMPPHGNSIVGEQPSSLSEGAERGARLADLIVANCTEPEDIVLHDVVVYRPLYEWAT